MKNQPVIDNDSFCYIPWTHQMVPGNGAVNLCCHSGKSVGSFRTIEQDWNNEVIRKIRADMVAGRPIAACRGCVAHEKFGNYSPRMRYNTRWPKSITDERVLKSIENDFHVEEYPVSLDIRFGNLCNLVCKMCEPKNSSQIGKDFVDLQKLDPVGYAEVIGDSGTSFGYDGDITEEHWNTFERYMPFIRTLYLAGGEPTLSKDNIRLLKRCVELGYASSIAITINTNITNINTDLLEMLSQFHFVMIIASIDGIHQVQEYIRYPSKWETIDRNLNRIAAWAAEHVSRNLTIATTVQVYNILSLPQILDHFIGVAKTHGLDRFKFEIIGLIRPDILSIRNTTPLIRAIGRIRLQNWWDAQDNPEQWFFGQGEGVKSVLEMLQGESRNDSTKKLLQYSRFVDQNKKSKLETAIPDLYRLLIRDAG